MHAHLHKCIDAAGAIGSPTVGTHVGPNPHGSVTQNLAEEPGARYWLWPSVTP